MLKTSTTYKSDLMKYAMSLKLMAISNGARKNLNQDKVNDLTIQKDYKSYIDILKKHNVPLVDFSCPLCDKHIQTKSNPDLHDWDTLSVCPHCNATFLKITKSKNGDVVTKCMNL